MAGSKQVMSARQMERIAKALADPRRYEILQALRKKDGQMWCSDVRAFTGINPATLSHHMKELEVSGLVRSDRDGKFVCYALERHVLTAYLDQIRSDLTAE